MIENYSNPSFEEGSRPIYWKDERRVHPRLQCKGVARVAFTCLEAKIPGTLLDLSVAGCCIELDSPMPAIENPRVEVHLSVKGTALRVLGIVRQAVGGRRLGIEFTDVSSRRAEQIQALYAELSEMQNSAR